MFKKILIFFLSLAVIFSIIIFIAVFATGPSLPPGTENIIEEVLEAGPQDYLPGETGFTESSGVWISYKIITPRFRPKGDILLIAGIASDSCWWPPCFVKSLTESGYRVILFDNRSTGMSDWMKEYGKWRYTIRDMAGDGIAVMDSLKIKKAHILGVSMGGMIAQHMAISYPKRTGSFISIMSSAHLEDREMPAVPWRTVREVVRLSCRYGVIKSERNIIKLHIAIWQLFRNRTLKADDIKSIAVRVLFNLRKRRGYNPLAFPRQLDAIIASGSRYEGLKRISVPAMFIHGKIDPLIPWQHGLKCSQLVKGSSLVLIDKMGHDIPCSMNDEISGHVTRFISRVR
ncbi:MAG TPA: alpha/beta hydrolase [Spirochaetota bacterium]|nr:alpha/beta hydrolase [Spirochaetota bacterium]HPJ34919.1 alpha/beta hydrolase [Spirochaetota bacterium]